MATKRTFTERLKREITASPKKAAVLALVCLVAIWFWTPLVLKWVGKKSPAEESVAVSSEEENTTPAPVAAAPVEAPATETNQTAASGPTTNWQKILKWIHSDPKMKPHVAGVGGRDPFSPAASMRVAKVEEPAPTPPPEITPQAAGIFVSSTVVGFANRTALINGRTYCEEQEIAGTKSHDRFLLVEIRSKSVIMERNGRQYEVKIPNLENVQFDD